MIAKSSQISGYFHFKIQSNIPSDPWCSTKMKNRNNTRLRTYRQDYPECKKKVKKIILHYYLINPRSHSGSINQSMVQQTQVVNNFIYCQKYEALYPQHGFAAIRSNKSVTSFCQSNDGKREINFSYGLHRPVLYIFYYRYVICLSCCCQTGMPL